MSIALLSDEVINQIAAGEVIERPASVVKELVENALDAGARRVQITVERGGIALLRVTDDGQGIASDEVELAFARHATSKLRSIGDLQELQTLGFRGEALPSIAGVAQVTLTTRQAGEPLGREVRLSGGTILRSEECGAPAGTTVEVRNLFFNTPARRKFLKSEGAEAARIAALVTGLAVTRPDVAFTLVSEGRTLLQTPGQGDLRETLTRLLGEDSPQRLLPVEVERGGLRLGGLIGKAELTRANRAWELFAVNGRLVENRTLQVATEKAYGSLLPLHRYPVVHLRLELDPAEVDVNVHPAKREVRFRRESEVFGVVYQGVKEALGLAQPLYRPAPPRHQDRLLLRPASERLPQVRSLAAAEAASSYAEAAAVLTVAPEAPAVRETHAATSPGWRYLGQLAASYLVGETGDGLVVVDQHAAHERVLYEALRSSLDRAAPLPVQNLLLPQQVELDPVEAETFEVARPLLESLGFLLEPFGGRTVLIRAVPMLLAQADLHGLLADLGEAGLYGGRPPGKAALREAFLPRLACRAAVKAGQPLASAAALALFEQWQACSEPWTCPHGRPVALQWPLKELEASFLRR